MKDYAFKRMKIRGHYYAIPMDLYKRLQAYLEDEYFEEDNDWRDYERMIDSIVETSEPIDHVPFCQLSRMSISV